MMGLFHCKLVLCLTVFSVLTSGAASANVKIYLDENGKEPVVLFASSSEGNIGCQNLRFNVWRLPPIYIFTDTCIKFYQNLNCDKKHGKGRYVLGRKSSIAYTRLPSGFKSFDLCSSKAPEAVQIGNATFPKQIAQLHANIYRSVIRLNQEDCKQASLAVRPPKVVQNNEKVVVSYDYQANITIQEFLKIHRPAWLQYVDKLTSGSLWRVEFEHDDPNNKFVPFVNHVDIHSHIENAFANFAEENLKGHISLLYSVRQLQTFSANESIRIPACSKCNIESSVLVTYRTFWLESSVSMTGIYEDGQQIPAKILTDLLPEGLWYEDSWNEYSVQALSVDTIETQYGNILETSNKCKEIPECQSD